jgi:Cu2+-exporting ATPase
MAVRVQHGAGADLEQGGALPIAAGVFEPAIGLVLRPEIAALTMSGSGLLVAVNALLLRRLRLPSAA